MQNRKITFDIAPLPSVKGDENLIRQVWINLLSNAIKYTAKTPEALVQVGSISTNNETTFFVKDNGAGFNMNNFELFFKRRTFPRSLAFEVSAVHAPT